MKKIYIINAHEYYSFSEGKLNKALADKAMAFFESKGMEVRSISMQDEYEVEQEIQNHIWADVVILQSPVNWMGHPWSFKKYMDQVYSAGMAKTLCDGDGRHSDTPKQGYGSGGLLKGKKYMLSLTFNAPKEAFNNPKEYLFQGKSVDDLFFPTHMNFRFFGMEPLETFACYDVVKNPDVEGDFKLFDAHLAKVFG
jgi:modulator of drug activity B